MSRHVHDEAADRGIVEQVGANGLEHPPAAVVVQHAELDRGRLLAGAVEASKNVRDDAVAVVGMEERERVGAEQRVDPAPEEALGGGARVGQACRRRR